MHQTDMGENIGEIMTEASAWKNRTPSPEFEAVEEALRKEDSLVHLFKEQWTGMAGMAFMFVVTIFLGIYIRPYYDVGELHAFGKSGSSEVSNVLIELLAIFVFTALILVLAKYGKQWLIKYGMFAIFAIALLYTTVPLAHMFVLDFEPDPFEDEVIGEFDAEVVGLIDNEILITSGAFLSEFDVYNNTITAYHISDINTPLWNQTLPHLYGEGNKPDISMTRAGPHITLTSGPFIWVIDFMSGEMIEQFDCFTINPQTNEPEAHPVHRTGCSLAFRIPGAVYTVNHANEMFRWNTFETDPNEMFGPQGRWGLPPEIPLVPSEADFHIGEVLDDNIAFIGASSGLMLLEFEEFSDHDQNVGPLEYYDNASILFKMIPEESFSSIDMGYSPFSSQTIENETNRTKFVLVGDTNGDVHGLNLDLDAVNDDAVFGNAVMEIEESMKLQDYASTIQSVRLTDLDEDGFSDILLVTQDKANWMYSPQLIDRVAFDVDGDIDFALFTNDNDTVEMMLIESEWNPFDDHETKVSSGEITSEMFPLYGIQLLFWPTMAGILFALVLLILLIFHREWYVVNFAGIILGAGVCVMLGVTFVPTLAIIFMILAAIYDAWAVYKSKHMLDLADTMLDLTLPIMLVAPQEKGYSFKDEGHTPIQQSPGDGVVSIPKKKKAVKKEAMFMGLGDIIFPGMLVLSALQWLTEKGIAFEDAFAVAMTTLVGGLLGYIALMSFVARGRAQAGLPLLNGGAILGYVIGGMLIVGGEVLRFNLTW